MIKKYIKLIVLISFIGLIIFSYTSDDHVDEESFDVFTSFSTFELVSSNPDVYEIYSEDKSIGYLSFGDAYGYQSEILVGTAIDHNGGVLEVRILKQNETPSFIRKIYNAGFLENEFAGVEITSGFELGVNIDAVTGATVSSAAITKAVTEASQIIGSNYLSLDVPANTSIKFGVTEMVLIGMMILALLTYKFKNKKLRYLTMAYTIILLGFRYKQFIAYSWLVSLIIGDVPSFVDNLGWYILVIGSLLFILISGTNVYCAYICPFGAVQQAEKLFSGFDFFKPSPMLKKRLKIVPGIIAYIAFAIAIITEQVGVLSYEPFSLLFGRSGMGVQWVMLPLVLIMCLLLMGFYCHYACPVGFVLRLFVKLRRKTIMLINKRGEANG